MDNTTTQTIVQVAPSTAIATATNYGPGSASATAVAAPTQIASQSAHAYVDDPALNVGSGNQTADNHTSNTTTQSINQYAPTTATADATSYNGHAVATAIAAPTQIASQSAFTEAFGQGNNVGLGSGSCGLCGHGSQSASNTTTNTTTQSISQYAPTTATADATSGGDLCGICNFGGNSGTATAIAVAKPVQIASQSSTDKVYGVASNVNLGSGHQTATNTSKNTTDQDIDQSANSTATATATNNPFGFGNSQSATAVAVSQPSQLAVQGALNVVSGSANNDALGFGCDCFFGGSHQTAINSTTNHTDQDITQHGNADATATANNDAFGFGNHQTATAIAIAAPKQSASEYSAANVSGIATNVGLGHGTDQFAFNVTINDFPFVSDLDSQDIQQNANSDATADANNNGFGFGSSQNAQATAIATPNQSASTIANNVFKGQAINTDLGGSSCSFCDLFGHGQQTATNETNSNNFIDQVITQNAPTHVTADAFNNGFGFDLGICEICGFNSFNGFGNNSGSIQNATAVAASAPTQRAAEAMNFSLSGSATNVNIGNSAAHQTADNTVSTAPEQTITQNAPSDVYADAENNPELVAAPLTSGCFESCGFGSNSVHAQNATAIATAQPSQTASEAMTNIESGSATNIASGNSGNSCGSCGCDFLCGGLFGHTQQTATNNVTSNPTQTITQNAPTSVDAYAYNYPSSDSILPEVACFSSCGQSFGHTFGGTQSATAIAAAQPIQSASQLYSGVVTGQALNTAIQTGNNSCGFCGLFGGSDQWADNTTDNEPTQTITQNAPTSVDAYAENWAFGHGSQQQALAISVAAPRQSASQAQKDNLSGAATNVNLSSGSGDQWADNTTYNTTYQTITQDAPVSAEAEAYNYPSTSFPWFFGFGNGGLQSATAIAAGAPVQSASQALINSRISGVASNVNLGSQCGFCGFFGHGLNQDATNVTYNDVDQDITQSAPTTVYADAENLGQTSGWWCLFFSGCSNNPQSATAIATSAAKQIGNQSATNLLIGSASNVNLSNSNSGCFSWFCGFGHQQDAANTTLNTLDQYLTQDAPADSMAYAFNYPTLFGLGGIWGQGGNWNSCGSCGGLGLNTQSTLAGLNSNLGFTVPSFNAPLFSTPVTLTGLPTGLGNWGSTNVAFGSQDLGIKLGLNISNSESLNLPTISNLLHGVSLFGLLQGVVALNLNLSVTTPWVQYAAAVAHQTPFSVLFSVSQQTALAPWYGILL